MLVEEKQSINTVSWVTRGDIITWDNIRYVVLDWEFNEPTNFWRTIKLRQIIDGKDGVNHPIKKINVNVMQIFDYHGKWIQKVMDENQPFLNIPRSELGEIISQCTHADKLPKDNPLKNMQYWNAPGGKNLTIIACIEWALEHIKQCHKELPCRENTDTMKFLTDALLLQRDRRRRRCEQKLLGTNKAHTS